MLLRYYNTKQIKMNSKLTIALSCLFLYAVNAYAQINIKTNTNKLNTTNGFDLEETLLTDNLSYTDQSTSWLNAPNIKRVLDINKIRKEKLNSFEEVIRQSFKTNIKEQNQFI